MNPSLHHHSYAILLFSLPLRRFLCQILSLSIQVKGESKYITRFRNYEFNLFWFGKLWIYILWLLIYFVWCVLFFLVPVYMFISDDMIFKNSQKTNSMIVMHWKTYGLKGLLAMARLGPLRLWDFGVLGKPLLGGPGLSMHNDHISCFLNS